MNTPDFPRRELSAEERASRDAYVAAKLEAECKQKRTVTILGISTILIAALIGWYAITQNKASVMAQNAAREQQQSMQKLAQQQLAIDKQAQEYEQFYAGKVQAYDTIMGSRNLIPNLPVRQRPDIESDIAAEEAKISEIKSQMQSAIRTQNYNYRDSSGRAGSGSVSSYNNAEMNRYLQQLRSEESKLAVLLAELRRDDYFQGRVAGNEL